MENGSGKLSSGLSQYLEHLDNKGITAESRGGWQGNRFSVMLIGDPWARALLLPHWTKCKLAGPEFTVLQTFFEKKTQKLL